MKIYIAFFILFLLLNLIIVSSTTVMPIPFYNMFFLLIPVDLETGAFLFGRFVLNLVIYIVFLTYIQKQIEEQFVMMNYTLTRTDLKTLMMRYSAYTYKKILTIVAIWLCMILIFSQMNGLENIETFISLALSMILTLFIWIECFIFLKLTKMSFRSIYLLSFFLIALLTPFAEQLQILNLFIIGSIDILVNPLLWIGIKVTVWGLLFFSKTYLFKNIEILGVDTVD